ncbi:MAG TPA: hypothetical protein VK870_13815 [Ignavibacteriaceae bacterium]|nr:hypothetical protein [Ignavibacteriaceae bacterium]
MAILIEGISVVIRAKALSKKYPGGWEKFKENVPNQTLCADGELVRVGFMAPTDSEDYIHSLEAIGLVYLKKDVPQDIIVIDQQSGPTKNCSWIEFGKIELDNNPEKQISASWLKGSEIEEVVMPENWKYEDSLSAKYTFIRAEDINGRMIRFKKEDGIETYYDLKTGKTSYVGRTNK